MSGRRQHNERKLQQTTRFTPKIREYLAALPNDRELELERFMALSSSSPASSSVSVGGHSSGGKGVAAAACAAAMECQERRQQNKALITHIPIVLLTADGSKPDEATSRSKPDEATSGSKPGMVTSVSVEDLCTPTKGTQTPTPQMFTRKTQTPESVLKSHKRLEWDPSADVGYRCERAASTSNISTLERSVLEAVMPNRSESDLNRLQREQQQKPPLASSTFVNCQTMTTTPVPSQSSRRESGLTSAASSFDYQRPSTAATTSSHSSSSSRSAGELLRHVEQQRQEREYTAQLKQVLCNRRQQNKENQQPEMRANVSSSSTASSCPPSKGDLDLGVDLLCSLVSKRSLSHGQKKQLIRDIAKRLACLDLVASSSNNSRAESSSRRSKSVSQHKEHKQDQEKAQPNNDQPIATLNSRLKDTATNTGNSLSLDKSLPKQGTLPVAAPVTAPMTDPATDAMTDAMTDPVPAPVPEPARTAVPVPAPRTRIATPIESPAQSCSYASTSSSASNEPITQKTNQRPKSRSSTDAAEQAAMQEWLNPMTQSEIDYEEKRQRCTLDSDRRTQLDWIETEIRRLRTLQNLLSSAATEAKLPTIHGKGLRIPILLIDEPSVQGSNQRPMKAATKERRPVSTPPAATATAAAEKSPPPPPPPPPPPLRERPPPAPAQRQLQRSKMATPSLSHSGSSESVCSFVQQRQRQFMAHYQNQQQQRLEQQQQLLRLQQHQQQQQQQLIHRQQQQLQPICPLQHQHQHRHLEQPQQQHQQYIQMQYAQTTGNTYGCVDEGAVYYQVVNSQGAPCYVHAMEAATVATTMATTAAAAVGAEAATAAGVAVSNKSCTATSSTSSMMCISSEMSIPMGMVNACEATTTTTTTTTHQYDDVACHQQLQLHRRHSYPHPPYPRETSSGELRQRQQMLQVRPRGIAYVIQFSTSGDACEILTDALTLQDHLQRSRPLFCAQSKERKAILNQMQLLRNERRRELDELIENSSLDTLDRRLKQLPPPVTSRVRIFSTKEMKALTNKRCESLPEVLAAQNREREERRRRSNRIMRDVFNRRLQRRVRRGKLSLNHSRTVI